MADHYGMEAKQLESQYKNHLSVFRKWDQLAHAQDWILFEKNIGPYVGLDETSLSTGELYTILINKEAKGKKGTIIAMIKGTSVEKVSKVLLKLSRRRRFQVREITLDMAPNMAQIARICFPAAKEVIDRFHVQKLAFEAVQEMRIKARWEALDKEMVEIAYAKASGQPFIAETFSNGDSRKQLLARSRYLLFKKESLWSESQQKRAKILFREYPQIKKAYYLSMGLGLIFHQAHTADWLSRAWHIGMTRWIAQAFFLLERSPEPYRLIISILLIFSIGVPPMPPLNLLMQRSRLLEVNSEV